MAAKKIGDGFAQRMWDRGNHELGNMFFPESNVMSRHYDRSSSDKEKTSEQRHILDRDFDEVTHDHEDREQSHEDHEMER